MFNDFDDFLEFCNCFNDYTYHKLRKSSLYQYNSKYYLCISVTNSNINTAKLFHCVATEFGVYISNADLFERKLIEYGKVVFKSNAINVCIKHFS